MLAALSVVSSALAQLGEARGSTLVLLITAIVLGLGLFVVAMLGLGLLRQILGRVAEQASAKPDAVDLGELPGELLEELRELRRVVEAGFRASSDEQRRHAAGSIEEQRAVGQRLAEGLQRLSSHLERDREVSLVPSPPAPTLSERVTNRLLAMGYDRVQIVTDCEHIDAISSGDGDVLVEAARQGVIHKGRVRVRSGRVADVDVNPTYSIFP